MKLKSIYFALVAAGAVLAAPAFADTTTTVSTQQQLDQMKAELTKMQSIINQNSAGGYQQVADWFNRITLSGMINADAAYANRAPNFGLTVPAASAANPNPNTKGSVSNLSIQNANLFIDALINDWTTAHVNFQYSADHSDAFILSDYPEGPTLDEAYITIGNFAQTPVYFRVGREYVPFGDYDRYPLVINPTQLLTETSATAAQAGFVSPVGFYGSLYTFRGIPQFNTTNYTPTDPTGETTTNRPRVENLGANLGYAYTGQSVSGKLDAGWISNMADVNYLAEGMGNNYVDKVNGLSLSGDLNAGPFDAAVRYVKALQDFNVEDIGTGTASTGTVTSGAAPEAYGAELGYSFPVAYSHDSRIGVGYQHTRDSSPNLVATAGVYNSVTSVGGFGLPKDRYYALYSVNVSKWTDLGFEVFRDHDYSTSDLGTGKAATAGVVRLGVKFA